MKNLILTLSFTVFSAIGMIAQTTSFQSWNSVASQRAGVLNVNYLVNYPFAYSDPNGADMGIEIDIIREFEKWLETYKGVTLKLNYKKFENFDTFYNGIKDGGNGIIGLGSVTISKEREKWAKFSQPYLKNVAVLASSLDVQTLGSLDDFSTVFKDKVALVVKGSSHEKVLLAIKADQFPEMVVSYASNPKEMLIKMKSDPKYFGYVDIITYMAFTKEQGGILRVHRAADIQSELFGFVFPPNSDWNTIFNEFMVGGFGFTATDEYHAILEKYLEMNVINEVQLR
jgi:ABC-type amino acid transport substrate-binding protein|tara:strand:- start:5105 stop:5959 length:855 start_codon:yes stop_codon:yes gene_type:complete